MHQPHKEARSGSKTKCVKSVNFDRGTQELNRMEVYSKPAINKNKGGNQAKNFKIDTASTYPKKGWIYNGLNLGEPYHESESDT